MRHIAAQVTCGCVLPIYGNYFLPAGSGTPFEGSCVGRVRRYVLVNNLEGTDREQLTT